jgi:hypothetical protein
MISVLEVRRPPALFKKISDRSVIASVVEVRRRIQKNIDRDWLTHQIFHLHSVIWHNKE